MHGTAVLMYKIRVGEVPSLINEHVQDVSALHSRSTRPNSENNFYLEGRNLAFGLKATSIAGRKIWNSLPVATKDAQSLEIFKVKLKECLMA